jgi:DNA polymerase III subunit chi
MLAEVEFHTGLDDPLAHACRLLRKAVRQGARVCVATPRPDRLSARLWSFEAEEFLAHARPGAAASAWARSPVWLVEDFAQAPVDGRPAVWVSIAAAPAALLQGCERLVELVGSSPEESAAGRGRWKHYREQGLTPVKRFDGAAGPAG